MGEKKKTEFFDGVERRTIRGLQGFIGTNTWGRGGLVSVASIGSTAMVDCITVLVYLMVEIF